MTDVQKQLLIDYAAGRPLALMRRDLNCSEGTVMKRVREAIGAVEKVAEYRRKDKIGLAAVAAYWKVKYMQMRTVSERKRIRATRRWRKTIVAPVARRPRQNSAARADLI